MQTLALENYGISELSFDEQRETDGGNPAWLLAAIAYFCVESATNPTSSVNNLLNGYNSVRNKH
jgi:hypothetical protein